MNQTLTPRCGQVRCRGVLTSSEAFASVFDTPAGGFMTSTAPSRVRQGDRCTSVRGDGQHLHAMHRTLLLLLVLCVLCAAGEQATGTGGGSRMAVIPRVDVAPGVALPMLTMGGVVQPGYPDPSNYSLWLELGGRGFDSAWEYQTEKSIAAAIRASGLPRSEVFVTSKIPGSLHGGCCGCPGAMPPGQWPPCQPGKNGQPACHGVCFPASGHYTPAQAKQYIARDLEDLGPDIGYIDLLLMHEPCDYIAPYPYNASAETAGALLANPPLLGLSYRLRACTTFHY
jgi:hypothetical protein